MIRILRCLCICMMFLLAAPNQSWSYPALCVTKLFGDTVSSKISSVKIDILANSFEKKRYKSQLDLYISLAKELSVYNKEAIHTLSVSPIITQPCNDDIRTIIFMYVCERGQVLDNCRRWTFFISESPPTIDTLKAAMSLVLEGKKFPDYECVERT